MVEYLHQFFREKIAPYRSYAESLPLEWRIEACKEARHALTEGIDAAFEKRIPVTPTTLDERLRGMYELTAELGLNMGRLLLDKSATHFRIGEDYAEIYSTVLSLFGEDGDLVKSILLREFEPNITKDRIRRKIVEALLN